MFKKKKENTDEIKKAISNPLPQLPKGNIPKEEEMEEVKFNVKEVNPFTDDDWEIIDIPIKHFRQKSTGNVYDLQVVCDWLNKT